MTRPRRHTLTVGTRALRREAGELYRRRWIAKSLPPFPQEALLPIDEARDVLLLCSRMIGHFDAKIALQELAFAHELAARSRQFAIADEPRVLFEKSIVWFLPNMLVAPPLWDYSRQVHEFVLGLERQGNTLFCSSDEMIYWENKAAMHRKFAETGVQTPETRLLTRDRWRSVEFDLEPVLLKEEHSAGSEGIHHFSSADEARGFVATYPFRPGETLIMQEVVPGATRDLRLTMVGEQMIPSATFWRSKPDDGVSGHWTTTASKYGSTIEHRDIPPQAVAAGIDVMRKLGLRIAGMDLMWTDDDASGTPLVLETSPYFQPNPPKPERYEHLSYSEFKQRPYVEDGYLSRQYVVFRSMAAEALEQHLF